MNKMTRVRFKFDGTETFTTIQSYLGNEGKLLKALIDVPGLTVSVVQVTDNGNIIIESRGCASISKGKVLAKKMLKLYGVNFLDEVRNKVV